MCADAVMGSGNTTVHNATTKLTRMVLLSSMRSDHVYRACTLMTKNIPRKMRNMREVYGEAALVARRMYRQPTTRHRIGVHRLL
jgi:hypothetical protein